MNCAQYFTPQHQYESSARKQIDQLADNSSCSHSNDVAINTMLELDTVLKLSSAGLDSWHTLRDDVNAVASEAICKWGGCLLYTSDAADE